MILIGNISVAAVRLHLDERGLQFWFIGSLVLSDILMSFYLIIIGYSNFKFKGKYFEKDKQWRSSNSCTVAGVISLLSSQVSLFMITVITLERFLSVVFPTREGCNKLGSKIAKSIVLFAWIIGSILAITPALLQEYFNSKHLKFYGQNTVCLPLQLPNTRKNVLGWEYCLVVFGGLNTVLCVFIAVSYVTMYKSMKNPSADTSVRRNENSSLAKRMFGIVLTSLCCWFPVIVCLFLALGGFASSVSEIHAWTAVCFFPINAALNPIMYTFSTPNIREKIKNVLKTSER